jgi:hypothetical protein
MAGLTTLPLRRVDALACDRGSEKDISLDNNDKEADLIAA